MEKLRISSYVIPIKLEDEINKYMLMHGYVLKTIVGRN